MDAAGDLDVDVDLDAAVDLDLDLDLDVDVDVDVDLGVAESAAASRSARGRACSRTVVRAAAIAIAQRKTAEPTPSSFAPLHKRSHQHSALSTQWQTRLRRSPKSDTLGRRDDSDIRCTVAALSVRSCAARGDVTYLGLENCGRHRPFRLRQPRLAICKELPERETRLFAPNAAFQTRSSPSTTRAFLSKVKRTVRRIVAVRRTQGRVGSQIRCCTDSPAAA